MQNVSLLSENETKTLDQIADILMVVEFDTDEIAHANEPDEDGEIEEMSENDIKNRAAYLHYWVEKAETSLRAILSNRYDHEKHNLSEFELPK